MRTQTSSPTGLAAAAHAAMAGARANEAQLLRIAHQVATAPIATAPPPQAAARPWTPPTPLQGQDPLQARVALITVQRAYEANLSVIERIEAMRSRVLRIGGP